MKFNKFMFLLLSTSSMGYFSAAIAASKPLYILLGTTAPLPYTWLAKDGNVISDSISDNAGRAFIEPKKGVRQYYLDMFNGVRYPVTIESRCWKLEQSKFESCIQIGELKYTPARIAEEKAAEVKANEKQALKKQSVEWVYQVVPASKVKLVIDNFLKEHNAWWNSNKKKIDAQIAAKAISCNHINVSFVNKANIAAAEEAAEIEDVSKRRSVYIESAKTGNWNAASKMVIDMLHEEDWESAAPVIAWMIHHNVPAAYNRMSELIADTGSYESGSFSTQGNDLVASLMWHGAILGDPGSQAAIAQHYDQLGMKALAGSAWTCAIEQRPGFKRFQP